MTHDMTTAPVNLDAPTSSGSRCNPTARNEKGNLMLPPTIAQHLDDIVNRVDCIRHDINAEYRQLPDDAPLFACTDIVVALGHLRLAAVALDKATDLLEAANVQAVR